jgi:hypothetical protein
LIHGAPAPRVARARPQALVPHTLHTGRQSPFQPGPASGRHQLRIVSRPLLARYCCSPLRRLPLSSTRCHRSHPADLNPGPSGADTPRAPGPTPPPPPPPPLRRRGGGRACRARALCERLFVPFSSCCAPTVPNSRPAPSLGHRCCLEYSQQTSGPWPRPPPRACRVRRIAASVPRAPRGARCQGPGGLVRHAHDSPSPPHFTDYHPSHPAPVPSRGPPDISRPRQPAHPAGRPPRPCLRAGPSPQ